MSPGQVDAYFFVDDYYINIEHMPFPPTRKQKQHYLMPLNIIIDGLTHAIFVGIL